MCQHLLRKSQAIRRLFHRILLIALKPLHNAVDDNVVVAQQMTNFPALGIPQIDQLVTAVRREQVAFRGHGQTPDQLRMLP